MSRTIQHTRSWKPLFAALALLACCLAGQNAVAQALTAFTISTSPSGAPAQGGSDLVITPLLTGSTTTGPSGSVDIFTSSAADCSIVSTDLGTQPLTISAPVSPSVDYTSTATDYDYSGPYGTYYVCATYVPGGATPFTAATTSPGAQAAFYAATALSALQQSFPVAGQPVTISLALSTPAGQPAPTGTITISVGDTPVGTATASASGISPSSLQVTLPSANYSVDYSGDANYAEQDTNGTAYYSNPLVSISPAAVQSGSADTTLTVNGNGFISGSTVQITSSSGAILPLATTYVSANKLTAVVPTATLATAQVATIQVVTSGTTSNSVNFNIYALQTNTAAATATPSTFVYGQTSAATFGATILPVTGLGLPTGSVAFTLTGPGASPTQLALGSATLSAAAGSGAYVPGTIDSAVDTAPARAVTADLNGDGYADVIAIPAFNYQSGSDFPPPYLQVFLSTGTNSFASEQTVPTDCPVSDFAVGDINGDGIPDLIALCPSDTGGPVATYMLGNGDGTFQAPVAFLSNTSLTDPTNIVMGDFNGDGKMDVALVDGYNGFVQVFTGSATFGTFTALGSATFTPGEGGILPPVVADFNQDGKSDIAILEQPNGATASLLLLTSTGNGQFSTQTTTFDTPAESLDPPAITDVNGDGYPDIVVADPGYYDSTDTGQIFVFENSGSGTLNALTPYPLVDPQAVTGTPFPVVGKPSTTVTQPWSIFVSAINADESLGLTGLTVSSSGTITPVYTGLSDGYDQSSYGYPDLIFAGDFDGNGYDDVSAVAFPVEDGGTSNLLPLFYTNSSTASLTGVTQLPNAGTYNLAASYPGDKLYAASTTPNVPITITQATPAGTLQVPATATYGQPVTFTATMTGIPGGTIPSGTVDFSVDGSDESGPVTLQPGAASSTAQFTISNLTASTTAHQITAVYSGDTNYTTLNLGPSPITVATAGFSLALTTSATTVTAGSFVTFTAQAAGSGAFPTGEPVTLSGLPTSAAIPVIESNGQAVYRFGMLPPGTYTVQASYASDGNFQAATSNAVTLTVNPAPVTVTVTSSASPVTYPAPVNLTATVNSLGLGIATGTVDFAASGTSLGSGTLAIVNGASGMNPTGTYDSTTSNVIAEAVGDFNHDGNPDLAVLESNGSGTNLLVSLGNGDGTFQAPTTYALTDPGDDALVAADFNGDGYTDLAIASSVGYVYIYTASGDAAGDLTLTQNFDLDSSPIAIAAGDFNKDGSTDLAVLGTNSVSVYLNSGSGTFATSPAYVNTGQYSQYTGIAVADFNKDGYADIAVSGTNSGGDTSGTPAVNVFTNNAQPTLGFTEASYPVNGSATLVAAGDFNGDGYPDLAVVSGSDSTVEVLLNQAGTFTTGLSYATVAEPDAITTADFNKDGFDDIAIAGVTGGAGGGSGILFGSAAGAMTTATNLPTTYGTAIATADLNNDGNPDLLIGYQSVAAFVDSTAQATIANVVLPGGTDPITGTFTPTPATGAYFASATSPAFNQIINPATPVVNWATPAPIYYGTPLSSAQLDAASAIPGTYIYNPAAGAILASGNQTLSVLFTPTSSDYMPVTATVTLDVQPGSILTSILPSTGNLGDPATTITLTGIGFTAQSLAELNGTPLATTYVSPTSLLALIPASFFTSVQSEPMTVLTPGEPSSSAVQFSVVAPPAQATLTGPSTAGAGSQPTVNLQLSQSYPVPVTATLTLTVQPSTSGGLTDPAVQFASGGDTATITIPANTTTATPLQLQAGTLAGTITVTTTLSADGTDVTPATLQPVVIQVPTSPPTITSVSIARSGQTVTVTVQGYSNTRAVQSADFQFTAASGAQISNPDVTVQLADAFGGWYALTNSDQYGSAFSYVQTFTLSEDASSVGSVSVTLSNSLGSSNTESAQ